MPGAVLPVAVVVAATAIAVPKGIPCGQFTFVAAPPGTGIENIGAVVPTVGQIPFPSTGIYSTWSTTTVNVPLNTGGNIVQLSVPAGATAAPELNYLVISYKGGLENPAAPAQPANLTATVVSPYQVNLSWSPSPTASAYNVFQNQRIIANNVSGASYSDTRILFGKSAITYWVQAVNQGAAALLA